MKLANLLREFVNPAVEMLDPVTVVFGMLTVLRMFVALMRRARVKFASQVLLNFASLVPNRLALVRETGCVKMLGCLVKQAQSHMESFGALATRRFVMPVLTLAFAVFGMADESFQFGLHCLSFFWLSGPAKLVSFAFVLFDLFVQPALAKLPFNLLLDAGCFVRVAMFP